MEIKLKKIEYSERLSEETNAFSADLYIEGKRAGLASNHGHGGPTNYYPINAEGRELISKAEAYCKSLPPETFTDGGKDYSIDMNLEYYIDKLLEDHLEQKALQQFRRKVDKETEFSVVIGVPDNSFRLLTFKSPIEMILVHPNGPDIIKKAISDKVLPDIQPGEMVLNTNIPEQILREAGLNEKQYLKPHVPEKKNAIQQKRKGKGI